VRTEISWTPTEKRGFRRVGKGSRGGRSMTEAGMPDKTEMLYTYCNVSCGMLAWEGPLTEITREFNRRLPNQ